MRLIVGGLLCFCFSVSAQRYNGFLSSEFSGVLNTRMNPAFIANSPYKFDISLINFNSYISNDFGYLYKNEVGDFSFERIINSKKRFVVGDQTIGGVSGLFSISKKSTIAIQYQFRNLLTGTDITPDFGERNAVNQSGEIVTNLWSEAGLTYATMLFENKYERLKAGVTAKLMGALGSVFTKIDNLTYARVSNDSINLFEMEGTIGYSSNLNDFEYFDGNQPIEFPKIHKVYPAVDLGFAYEKVLFRDDPKRKNGTSYKPDILYEYRIGISIMDIGIMKYDYGSAAFEILNPLSPADPINYRNLMSNQTSFRTLRDSLSTVTNTGDLIGDYSISLPTRLELSYDYNLRNGWFFNMSSQIDLSKLMGTDYQINYPSSIMVTARYDMRNWGTYFPFYWNLEGDTELGFGLRYGPLTVGTHSLGSIFSSELKSIGMFFNLSIHQLKANAKKRYCFSGNGIGTARTRRSRTPVYKRKKFLFW